MKPIQEEIDKALGLGKECNLGDKEIEYLIKALAQERFGEDANLKLCKYNIKIIEEDKDGIEKAKKFVDDYFDKFLDLADEKAIAVLNRRRQERKENNLKYIIVSDSMIALKHDIVTVQEVAKSLKEQALANWGNKAKTKLAELGLVTDRDLNEYMKQKFAMHYIEDPEGDNICDVPIID